MIDDATFLTVVRQLVAQMERVAALLEICEHLRLENIALRESSDRGLATDPLAAGGGGFPGVPQA